MFITLDLLSLNYSELYDGRYKSARVLILLLYGWRFYFIPDILQPLGKLRVTCWDIKLDKYEPGPFYGTVQLRQMMGSKYYINVLPDGVGLADRWPVTYRERYMHTGDWYTDTGRWLL